MEHIMDRIRTAAEYDTQEFIKEWFSGQFDCIRDCCHYEAVLAFCKALNVLGRYQYCDYESVTPNGIIKEEKERLKNE